MDLSVAQALRPVFRSALNVGLAGNGEPFLHPQLFDFLDIIVAERAVPSIVTNFTLIDEKASRHLIEYGPLILTASIDGGSKEVYETMRAPAVFDKTRENLMTLKHEKQKAGAQFPAVHFIVTLSKLNQDDLPNIIALARQAGADCISVQTCYPYSEDARRQVIDDLERVEEIIAEARDEARRADIQLLFHPMGFGLPKRLDAHPSGAALYCPNLWTQLHVLINGDVRVCCFSVQETIGNVTRDSLEDIWNHPRAVQARRDMLDGRIPSDCPNCHMLEYWNKVSPTKHARAEFINQLRGR